MHFFTSRIPSVIDRKKIALRDDISKMIDLHKQDCDFQNLRVKMFKKINIKLKLVLLEPEGNGKSSTSPISSKSVNDLLLYTVYRTTNIFQYRGQL